MNDLKFAIQMELDGEKYYSRQAGLSQNKGIGSVCLRLAKEEKKHSQLLIERFASKHPLLKDADTLADAKSLFKGLGNIKIEGIEKASQLDFYRLAMGKEKESIDLYTKYRAAAKDKEDQELFDFLIKQEKKHFAILEALVAFVQRPEEWVENAEFGIREDY